MLMLLLRAQCEWDLRAKALHSGASISTSATSSSSISVNTMLVLVPIFSMKEMLPLQRSKSKWSQFGIAAIFIPLSSSASNIITARASASNGARASTSTSASTWEQGINCKVFASPPCESAKSYIFTSWQDLIVHTTELHSYKSKIIIHRSPPPPKNLGQKV